MGKDAKWKISLNVKETLEAQELVRQRHLPDGTVKSLVRWHLRGPEKKSSSVSDDSSTSTMLTDESKAGKDVFLWMTNHEFMVCCPHLYSTDSCSEQATSNVDEDPKKEDDNEAPSDVEDMDDMSLDVIKLVTRARKQMHRMKKENVMKPLVSLSHTIKVLSTYAGLGSLAGVFRETGALDLILELLWTKDVDTRRAAGRMLRALALHDAGSRAYVLLSLTQDKSDDDVSDQKLHYADFENRAMVMEMFAETASGEEAHAVALDSVQLPQVPGKALFTLMKCYLRVTSLMDVNNSNDEKGQNKQILAWMWLVPAPEVDEAVQQFEVAMAISNLIFELNRIMDWHSKRSNTEKPDLGPKKDTILLLPSPGKKAATTDSPAPALQKDSARITSSQRVERNPPTVSRKPLFMQSSTENTVDPGLLASLLKSNAPSSFTYRLPDSFASKRDYTEYVRSEIKPGFRVRACQSYQDVSEGDEGVYRQHNHSNPPVQVFWHSLNRTYWVHWHNIQLIGEDSTSGTPAKGVPKFLSHPEDSELWPFLSGMRNKVKNLYGVEYSTAGRHAKAKDNKADDVFEISQRDWWVLLFYISQLTKKKRETLKEYLSGKHPTAPHMSLINPSKDDAIVVMEEILRDITVKEKEDMCVSPICKYLVDVIEAAEKERTAKMTQESDEENKEKSKKEVEVTQQEKEKSEEDIPGPSKDVAASKPTRSKSESKLTEEDEEDSISVEARAKATEMGLRIGLISNDETERLYFKIFLDNDNYDLSNRLWRLRHDSKHMAKVSAFVSKSGRDGRIIALTVLQALAASTTRDTLVKKKDLSDIFSNVLTAADDDDNLVVIAYLHFILACFDEESDAGSDPEMVTEMALASTGHLKSIFDMFARFPEDNQITATAIQCANLIMGASSFAKNPLINQDSVYMNMITAIISSIMATSDISKTSLASESSDTKVSYGGCWLLRSFMEAVKRIMTSEIDSKKQESQPYFDSGKLQSTLYRGLCVICMIARKDHTKALLKEEEFVQEFLAVGLKGSQMGSNVRRMMQRLKGLMMSLPRTDALEFEPTNDEFLTSDKSLDEEHNDDGGLVIDHFNIQDTESTSRESFASFVEKIKNSSTEDIRAATSSLMEDLVLPQLKKAVTPTGDCAKCISNLKTFLGDFNTVARSKNLILFETYWPSLVSSLQHILELCVSATNKSLSLDVATDAVSILLTLCELDKDFAVFLCGLEVKLTISRLLEKHGTIPNANELRDLVTACERQRALHSKLLAVVLGGCISTALHCIEDARRQHVPVNVPLFDQLLTNLCKGADVEVKEDKCWERIEVSSNPRQIPRLTDGNTKTYWESNGSSGAHWVNIYMKKGVVVRKLTINVAQEDSSYMPSRIVVFGGSSSSDMQTQLSSANLASTDRDIVLLENARRYWPIIRISIRRCQQGGIDTRIHGIEVVGPKPSFWPLLRRQLYVRTSLIYAVQVYSWVADAETPPSGGMKQVMRHKILDVPTKLVQAIKFEQDFADEFLPNAESALVLGQACRSALSVPILADMLAKSENPNGGKNSSLLENLLEAYLICNEDATTGDDDAEVFSSKLRHLLRLVVDLDQGGSPGSLSHPSKPGKEESNGLSMWNKRVQAHLKASSNENIKLPSPGSSTSIAGGKGMSNEDTPFSSSTDDEESYESASHLPQIAEQWLETVQKRCTQILLSITKDLNHVLELKECLSCADAIFNKYDFLKQCNQDLFGVKSQFSMVLAVGVRKSIMAIDLESKTKLSYVFNVLIHHYLLCFRKPCQYGDGMIVQLRRVYHKLCHFLSLTADTDFCHIFEFMFGILLSKRIMGHDCTDVETEESVVNSIQACFPSHRPIDLVQDALYSKRLSLRFAAACLEKCDATVAHLDSEDVESWLEMRKTYEFVRNGGFFASVYRPSVWPNHTLRMVPYSKLLQNLDKRCSRLFADFEVFFRSERIDHSTCMFSSEKPSLQWTTGGFCILWDLKNNVNLTVSSYQALILLCFNFTDEIKKTDKTEVESLLKHKILVISSPGMLGVSESIPTDVQTIVDGEAMVTGLWYSGELLQRQTQRRSVILDCAITHIMKKESHCTVDSLIEKAIKSCSRDSDVEQKRGKNSRYFFIPLANEVRSRIDHLLNLGYLHRKDQSSQVLHYNSEDSLPVCQTPRPDATEETNFTHASKSTSAIKEMKQLNNESAPDATSASIHADSLEQASLDEQNDNNSPARSSESEPETSRFSNSFLENAVFPVESTIIPVNLRKTFLQAPKQPPELKSFFSEDCFDFVQSAAQEVVATTPGSDALFLGINVASTTMTCDELLCEVRTLMERLSGVLCQNIENTEALLLAYEWNAEKLLDNYIGDQSEALASIGINPEEDNNEERNLEQGTNEDEDHCPVCLNPITASVLDIPPCKHVCCFDCWKTYLATKLDQDMACSATCPVVGCHMRPTTKMYDLIFEDNKDMREKYDLALVRSFVESDRSFSWCHNPKGCTRILRKTMDGREEGWCTACGWQTCFSCTYVEAHFPATCSHMSQWMDDGGCYEGMNEDAQSKHLARLIAKRCPNCQANIEKNDGCLHMKCIKCSHDFCWRCLQPWRPTHRDYYNCSSKVSKLAQASVKFVEYNKRCQFHNKAKQFAFGIRDRLLSIDAPHSLSNLKFAEEICLKLAHCRKILAYCNVFNFYSIDSEKMNSTTLHSAALENKTLSLQQHISDVLLGCADIEHALSAVKDKDITIGRRMMTECDSAIRTINEFSKQGMKVAVPSDKPQTTVTSSGTLLQTTTQDGYETEVAINVRPAGMSDEDDGDYSSVPNDDESDEEDDDDDDDDNVGHMYSTGDEEEEGMESEDYSMHDFDSDDENVVPNSDSDDAWLHF